MDISTLSKKQLNEELTKRKASVEEVERVIESRKESNPFSYTTHHYPAAGNSSQDVSTIELEVKLPRADAQIILDLIRALIPAKRFVPKENEDYFYWCPMNKAALALNWSKDLADQDNLVHGNCFPFTDEGNAQCDAYGSALTKAAEMILGKV